MAVSTFFLDCSSLCWDNYKLVLSSHNLCKNIFIIVLKPKFLRKILPWVEGPHAWLQLCEVSLRKTKEKENHETFLAKFIPILRHGPKYTWLYSCSFHWCSLLELWIKGKTKNRVTCSGWTSKSCFIFLLADRSNAVCPNSEKQCNLLLAVIKNYSRCTYHKLNKKSMCTK